MRLAFAARPRALVRSLGRASSHKAIVAESFGPPEVLQLRAREGQDLVAVLQHGRQVQVHHLDRDVGEVKSVR